MPISDATREEAALLVQRYPFSRSALLPLLHLVQSDQGYVSEDGIAFCADLLGLTRAEVGSVATFYTMFKREPFGDWLLSVCTNPTCKIAGGQDIYESYVRECGGHVDHEAGVMVEHVECLGICDAAPVVQINYEMYGPMTTEGAAELLGRARAGDPPASNWSGEVPPTIRDVHRELSGIEDGTHEQLVAAARRQALADVPPADRSGETDIPVTRPGGDPAGHGGRVVAAERAGRPADGGTDTGRQASVDGQPAVVEEVAARGASGVEEELAEEATGRQPAAPSPPSQDQPDLDHESETSREAADAPAAGTEEEPSSAGGDEAPPEQPVGEGERPSEADSEPEEH